MGTAMTPSAKYARGRSGNGGTADTGAVSASNMSNWFDPSNASYSGLGMDGNYLNSANLESFKPGSITGASSGGIQTGAYQPTNPSLGLKDNASADSSSFSKWAQGTGALVGAGTDIASAVMAYKTFGLAEDELKLKRQSANSSMLANVDQYNNNQKFKQDMAISMSGQDRATYMADPNSQRFTNLDSNKYTIG